MCWWSDAYLYGRRDLHRGRVLVVRHTFYHWIRRLHPNLEFDAKYRRVPPNSLACCFCFLFPVWPYFPWYPEYLTHWLKPSKSSKSSVNPVTNALDAKRRNQQGIKNLKRQSLLAEVQYWTKAKKIWLSTKRGYDRLLFEFRQENTIWREMFAVIFFLAKGNFK